MNITDLLERNARRHPGEVALVERDPEAGTRRELNWGAFDETANRVANALRARGLGKGDRVILLLMNSLEWLPAYFGILKAGAWAVPLNYRFSAREIQRCAAVAEAKALLFGPEFRDRVAHALDAGMDSGFAVHVGPGEPSWAEPWERFLAGASSARPDVTLRAEDEAALYFTSGTTGRPKPILLTHGNLTSACRVEQRHHGQTRRDNFILIPPLYHTGAKMHWFGSLRAGSRAVILKGTSPRAILETVSQEGGTIVWLLVPWAQDILDALDRGEVRLEDYRLDRWRLMHIGAQPVPPSLVRRWLRRFPGQSYDTNYGLSEASGPGCVHLGVENGHKVGAIGVAGEGWEARIVDEGGATVAEGRVGELLVKGPGVMREYYRNPEASADVLRDGWLHTGDMARRDEDGFIHLVDRKKDVIIAGGENIYPVEIEDHLQAHAEVRDAAVIGLPDGRLGEIPVAVVELRNGTALSEAEVLAHCEGLPRYKRPRRVFFGVVPRNPTGKIEKPVLRERYRATGEQPLSDGP